MSKWKPGDPVVVLQSKFEIANEMVSWYEQKLQELRSAICDGLISEISLPELKKNLEMGLRSIRSKGHASSLIKDDRRRIETTILSKEYYRRLDNVSTSCRKCWKKLGEVEPGSSKERTAVLDAIRESCDVLELGLEPVKLARDAYVKALNGTTKKRGRGRKKDPSLILRDRQIKTEFNQMKGKPSDRKRELAEKHDLSADYIGRIVRGCGVSSKS